MAGRRRAAARAEKKEKKRSIRIFRKMSKKADKERRYTGGNILERSVNTLVSDYDYAAVLLVTVLVLFGIVMVFSAGYYTTTSFSVPQPYYFLKRQVFFAASGMMIMFLFATRIDYHLLARLRRPIMVGSLLLLLALIPLGVKVNGAVRWLDFGGLRVTPSELSKLAMIIYTASFIAERPARVRDFVWGLTPLFLIMGVHAALILWQPNLSTAIVLCVIMVGIMFVAGMSTGYIAGLAAILAGGIFVILNYLQKSHWYARLTNWINPFADSQGDGYQVSQSLIALGNGGLKGLGIGNSISKTLYLPEPQNDFILAIIGEELGFIGLLILMAVYLVLVQRCFVIASKADDKLGLLMASGVGIMLSLQVIINVAVVTASMPATGITLPFVSYGGTSLWVFMAAMGILLNISRKHESVK